MSSYGKRLGIALTTLVITLGLNAVAVVSGVAEHTYGYLLGTGTSTRLEGVDERRPDRNLIAKAKKSECPKNAHPKAVRG